MQLLSCARAWKLLGKLLDELLLVCEVSKVCIAPPQPCCCKPQAAWLLDVGRFQ